MKRLVNFTYERGGILFEILMIVPLLILISLINNLSQKLQLSSGGRLMVYIFGIIGVTVHEFSHYLFCLIFQHKVTSDKFFKPNWETGVMGYVHHTYNIHNIYQSIGQVFISIAPMIVGSSLIILLSKLQMTTLVDLKLPASVDLYDMCHLFLR